MMETRQEQIHSSMIGNQKELLVLLMVFVLGGIFGFFYEELFYRIDLGSFVKRGTTIGPWIPIYGFGSVLIILATKQVTKRPFMIFLIAAAVSGVLEFMTGYLLYHGFGIRLWDYNVEIWNWFNIGGYICLRSVAFFGVSALFLRYVVYPMCEQLVTRLGKRARIAVAVIPAVLFATDILVSLWYHTLVGIR